jgi:2-polyprenyl-3-methyl-5-hydroxy-6-metoxy-1,4-benzoquinol methylase
MDSNFRLLVDAAAERYRGAGQYAWHFAKGKLGWDPVFHFLLKQGLLPQRGRLLDLGCGQGVLMSLLQVANDRFAKGQWPEGWPTPPRDLQMHGVELRSDRARAARLALGDGMVITQSDIRDLDLPQCSVITILDVLLYLDREEQRTLLEKCARAFEAGGVLLLREADASHGPAFQATHWAERIACWTRGQFSQSLFYRPADEWKALLGSLGFAVDVEPRSTGTPFDNVLFIARRTG